MDDWKNDATLGLVALNLGQKVVEMYDSCGIPIPDDYLDPKGPPVGDVQQKVIEMFILDAEDYTSMDPQKIVDEYQRMQKPADATGTEGSEAAIHLDTAHGLVLAHWQGDAAIAFAEQLDKITKFMDQQQERLVYAMQAMGMAFGMAVQFRQSYFDLAQATIEACRDVIDKRPPEPTVNSVMIALGREMVTLTVEALGAKNPKELAKTAIGWFKDKFEKSKESVSVGNGDASRVLNGYLDARQRLRDSYDGGLSRLRDWLDAQRSAYFSLNVPILDPLPSCTDVHSPD